MGNLSISFKRFLQNKNTVTVIGTILAIFVLYFAYTIRVKSAINPITVPYASEQILSNTKITEAMISTRQVPPSMLKGDVILNVYDIIDKYVNSDTVIPKGSLFYKRAVVERENIDTNNHHSVSYPNSQQLYRLSVDIYSTYGNAMLPGNYMDIWLMIRTADRKIMIGKFLSNVRIIDVHANNEDVFQSTSENRIPTHVNIALPPDYHQLLTAASKLNDVSIKLVPTNESLKDNPGDIKIASEALKKYINDRLVSGVGES